VKTDKLSITLIQKFAAKNSRQSKPPSSQFQNKVSHKRKQELMANHYLNKQKYRWSCISVYTRKNCDFSHNQYLILANKKCWSWNLQVQMSLFL